CPPRLVERCASRVARIRRISRSARRTSRAPSTTPSSRSRTPAEQSSPGPPPVRLGSRAHASPPRSLRSWLLKPPRSALRNTASARSTSSSRARDPDAKPQFARCRPPAWRLAPSRTSPPAPTTAAAPRSAAAS
ncbi:MAG: SSU ribosomal protein S11p (S14e), partial [uncultured Arthrobacter sp.]